MWQTIPFLLCDNEGRILLKLSDKAKILFNRRKYPLPKKWRYIWGDSNNNSPFKGKDFELANYSDEEIAVAINEEIPNANIDIAKIKEIRESGKDGIKELGKSIEANKIKINKRLMKNMFQLDNEESEQLILERPIFKVIDIIYELAALNFPPTYSTSESNNKSYFENILKNEK